MQRRARRQQRKLTPEVAERCDRGQRPRWGVLFGCRRRLLRSITASLCISEAKELPLLHLKDDNVHNVRWIKKKKKTHTIAIVCSTQRDGDDALLKVSVYVRLQKTWK